MNKTGNCAGKKIPLSRLKNFKERTFFNHVINKLFTYYKIKYVKKFFIK